MELEEVEKIVEEMKEMFGPLPNPEHEPARFAYLVKLYKYYKPIESGGMVHEQGRDEGAAQPPNSPEGELREEASQDSEGSRVSSTEVPEAC